MNFPRHTYKLGKHTYQPSKHTYQLGKHTYILGEPTLARMAHAHERGQAVQSCLYQQHREFIASGQACRHIKATSSFHTKCQSRRYFGNDSNHTLADFARECNALYTRRWAWASAPALCSFGFKRCASSPLGKAQNIIALKLLKIPAFTCL